MPGPGMQQQMRLALSQASVDELLDQAGAVDRYALRVIPLERLGETVVVDEVRLIEKVHKKSGERELIIRWRRIFTPLASGSVSLGRFGGDARVYQALRKLVSALVGGRQEEFDIARLIEQAERDVALQR